MPEQEPQNSFTNFPPPVFMPESGEVSQPSLPQRVVKLLGSSCRAFVDAYKGYRGFDQPFPPTDRTAFPEK